MSASGDPDSPDQIASQLIERTGILVRTQIITKLNLEREKEQSTFEEILAAITQDRPLATRIISLANSAWFGGRVKVDTVPVAFGRLGTKDFYKAAMAAALRFNLGEGAENNKWWQQSETVAHLCELVAQQLNPDLLESAFQVGLLHDCAVPLMTKHVTDYAYLAEEALGCSPTSTEMEMECNQTDHCIVGARLVSEWKFPAAHVAAVRHHHAQELAVVDGKDARQLLATLLIAKRVDIWSRQQVESLPSDRAEESLQSEMAGAYGVTKGKIQDIVAEMLRLYRLRQGHPA